MVTENSVNQGLMSRSLDTDHIICSATFYKTEPWPQTKVLICRGTRKDARAAYFVLKDNNKDALHVYCDGSFKNRRMGYSALAIFHQETNEKWASKGCVDSGEVKSSFVAEVNGLRLALHLIQTQIRYIDSNDIFIHSDSKSALERLQQNRTKDTKCPALGELVCEINEFHKSNQNVTLTFNWIPSHLNIPGNVAANKMARQALL